MSNLVRSAIITVIVAAGLVAGLLIANPSWVANLRPAAAGSSAPKTAPSGDTGYSYSGYKYTGNALASQTSSGQNAQLAADQTGQTNVIVTSGDGIVETKPDMAMVHVGAQAVAPTAQDAQKQVNDKISAITAKLKEIGIKEGDIQTVVMFLNPEVNPNDMNVKGTGEISQYRAEQDLAITVNDISQAANVLDAAIGAGANSGFSISFGLKDDSALRQQALEQAVKNARPKADAIARGLGVTITSVVSVVDMQSGPMYSPAKAMPAMGMGAGASSTDVYGGSLSVVATVQVTYKY